ncbi:MAG TPA: UDP-N-acetylmuramate--L-alanine ligase [Gemmatimonadaceae bacterium]|nr:UDP-N-acetylmuramate--L-alanine ligase [Gemmatimonadaceae bacterium]
MTIPADQKAGPIHFVGIAGAGMSALAELYVRRGFSVTGCDANLSAADDLRRLGITLFEGHDPSHVEGASEVVVTSAMRRDHPELQRARELGITVTRRAEALGKAVSGGELVAIAGTHGKTTTTVMTTEALKSAGLDPTGVAGGRVGSWNGNLSGGSNDVFVVEADEYDRSFHALAPTVAAVTNVEEDHLDIYPGGLPEIRDAFAQFVRGARFIVLCADDAGASTLPVPSSAEIIRYGIESADARLRASNVETVGRGSHFDISYDDKPLGRLALSVPGLHNVKNSLAAVASGIALDVELDAMRAGIESFTGVERRFEMIGEIDGVTIIDDYAHHPTEIAATLQAARAAYPSNRIIAAFQPHLYSRTRDFHREFANALSKADVVYLCDLYPAREQPIPGVTAALIASSMKQIRSAPHWEGPRSSLAEVLAREVKKGDVVITIGAGDITKTGDELKQLLSARTT